jgi:hypothetical protein
VTGQEWDILDNALAGVPIHRIAEAYGVEEVVVDALLARALHCVRECFASGMHPYFKLDGIEDARRNRIEVREVLKGVEQWERLHRPVADLIFRGHAASLAMDAYGLSRSQVNEIVIDAILKISGFLHPHEQAALGRDPVGWIKNNRDRVSVMLDRVPSMDGGRTFASIHFEAAKIPDAA